MRRNGLHCTRGTRCEPAAAGWRWCEFRSLGARPALSEAQQLQAAAHGVHAAEARASQRQMRAAPVLLVLRTLGNKTTGARVHLGKVMCVVW